MRGVTALAVAAAVTAAIPAALEDLATAATAPLPSSASTTAASAQSRCRSLLASWVAYAFDDGNSIGQTMPPSAAGTNWPSAIGNEFGQASALTAWIINEADRYQVNRISHGPRGAASRFDADVSLECARLIPAGFHPSRYVPARGLIKLIDYR